MSSISRIFLVAVERLSEAVPRVGSIFAGHSRNAGSAVNTAVDILEAASRKRIESVYRARVQARLTSEEGEQRSHWLVSRGDNVYAATVHNKNYDLPQSQALIRHLDDWLDATFGKKRIMIVEGRVPDPEMPSAFRKAYDGLLKRAFASERGEVAALVLKGKVNGVEVITGEEDQAFQFAELLRNHRPEHVLGYYVLRQMPQALAARKQAIKMGKSRLELEQYDMGKYLDETLDRFAPYMPERTDVRQMFDDLMSREYAHTGFSGKFKEGDEHWLMKETNDPAVTGKAESPVQKVSFECNQRRDRHFANLFQEKADEGYAVFGQFGIIHLLDVAPKIRALDNAALIELGA
ncbi:hypothetical protein ACWCPQ_12530 [Nocardia sp. NPDC001965]